ncbi:hypothetical protein ADL00_06970 [Streptomyces sp. AS58]|nr:hypothetical protein ADL00_06970 [Streptomyces sp. AS58]
MDSAGFAAVVEVAAVDACTEDEQLTGLFTMVEEHLGLPFTTVVVGVGVTVDGIDLSLDGRIVAVCSYGGVRQSVGILDLPLPGPVPGGTRWIEAYRHWAG